MVKWIPPEAGWLKGNTDGDSEGNLRPISIALCIKNKKDKLVVEKGSRINGTTSLVAEALAIRKCIQCCIIILFGRLFWRVILGSR